VDLGIGSANPVFRAVPLIVIPRQDETSFAGVCISLVADSGGRVFDRVLASEVLRTCALLLCRRENGEQDSPTRGC
jgi:hypothetical protein